MPKFQCTRCGRTVESGGAFAPVDTRCPTCDIQMSPQQPEAVPVEIAPPPMNPPAPAGPPAFAAQAYHPAERKKPARIWIYLSTIVGGILLVASGLLKEWRGSSPEQVGFAAGLGIGMMIFTMFLALLVAAVASAILLAFKRPFRSTLAGAYSISFFVLAALIALGQVFPLVLARNKEKREQQVQQVDGMMEDMERALAESRDADGMPKQTDFRIKQGELPKGASSMEVARHIVQSVMNDSIAIQNEYVAALEKEGLMRLLLPERLDADKDFSESRKIVAALRETAERYRVKSLAVAKSVPERLEKYDLSAAEKRDFLKGYGNKNTSAPNIAEQNWKLELSIIDHMERAIDHLEATRSDWILENGAVAFLHDKDIETYNAILADMDTAAAEQTKLQEAAKENFKEKSETLKKELTK
jgi:hypothetical protein